MKLRILDDAIRFRLTRSEVAAIGRGEPVEATTRFADGAVFRYVLEVGDVPAPHASFDGVRMQVTLPRARAEAWADSVEVPIRGDEDLDDGVRTLLVEKDFECLEPRAGEDASDRFPNPKRSRD